MHSEIKPWHTPYNFISVDFLFWRHIAWTHDHMKLVQGWYESSDIIHTLHIYFGGARTIYYWST